MSILETGLPWNSHIRLPSVLQTSLNNNDHSLKFQSPAHQRLKSAGLHFKEPSGIGPDIPDRYGDQKYIILAPSSAAPTDDESCSSTYESIHERETDECRDSSDTEDNGSIGDAGEFELATTSEEDNFYTNASSSGTDDELVITAFVTHGASDTSDSGDCEIAFFADTESDDSSSISDPELTRGDYWECVKCKNKKNTPKYRFCEKCFQIRKSLFPPPPTRKRSRNEYRQQLLRKQSSQLDRQPSTLSTKRPRSGTPDSQPSSLSSISSPKRRHIVDNNTTTTNNPPSNNRPTRKHSLLSKHSAGESTDSDFNSDQDSDLASPRSASSSNRIGFLNKQSPRAISRRKSSFAKVQQSATSSTGVRTFNNSSQSHDHDNSEPTTAVAELNYAAAPARAVSPLTNTNSNNSSLGYLATSPRKRCTPERRMASPKRLKLDLAEPPTSTNQPEPKPDNCMVTIGVGGKLNNKLFKNVLCTGGPSDTDSSDSGQASKNLPASSATQTTTSGFSSSSSQELGSPTFDSQDTYCSELGDFATALPTRTASTGMLEQLMDRNVLFPSSLSRNASSLSDMPLSQESTASTVDITKSDLGMCMVCLSNPKDGAFVHKKKVHLCCCYKCANQIWRQRKTCPICNGKVTTVAKLFAH